MVTHINLNPLQVHELLISFMSARALFAVIYLSFTYLAPKSLRIAGTFRLICFTIDQVVLAMFFTWFAACDLQTLWHSNYGANLPTLFHVATLLTVFTNLHICYVGCSLGEVVRTNLFVLALMGMLAFTKQPAIVNDVCSFAKYLGLVGVAWNIYVTLDFIFDRSLPSEGQRPWYKLAPYFKWVDTLFGSPDEAVLRNVYGRQCLTIFLLSNAIFTENANVWVLLLYGLHLAFCTIYTLRHIERYDKIQTPALGFMQVLFQNAVQGFTILLDQWRKNTVPVARLWAFVTIGVFCIGSVSPAYCAGEAPYDVSDNRPLGEGQSLSKASQTISFGVRQASEAGQRMASNASEFATESIRESAADLRQTALKAPSKAAQYAFAGAVGYGTAQMYPADDAGPSDPGPVLAEQLEAAKRDSEALQAENDRLQKENATLKQSFWHKLKCRCFGFNSA